MAEFTVTALDQLANRELAAFDVSGDRVLARFFGMGVGSQRPSFLALKRYLVQRMTEACGQKMILVELNVLEAMAP